MVSGMGRIAAFDRSAVAELGASQYGLITRAQALQAGMSDAALRHRVRDGGAWRAVLPGVYLTAAGKPDFRQRQLAALLYAGPDSVITGRAAMIGHGIPSRDRDLDGIDVLIPGPRRRRGISFVRVYRCYRMPSSVYVDGPLRFAPAVRAVADAVRHVADLGEARSLVGWAVQSKKVRIAGLATEAADGPEAGSGLLRAVLAEVADGVRSKAEGDLRDLIRRERLPTPLYNPRLYAGQEFIAMPDAWWPEAGVAVEVDSREWHLSPADWAKTMARHSRMSSHGMVVLHYPPSRLLAEAKAVAAEIRAALSAGRELPAIRTVAAR